MTTRSGPLSRAIAVLLLQRPERLSLSLAVWGAIATASVMAASLVAASAGHLQDFEEVHTWFEYWGFGARNPYRTDVVQVDYSPQTFLVLWPLHALPFEQSRLVYLVANVVITVGAAWFFTRWAADRLAPSLSPAAVAATTAIVLSTSHVRASLWLGQTISIAIVLGVLALRTAGSAPVLSAVCLALSAFKPHIALGFGLALLFARRTASLVIAAACVVLLWQAFAWSLDEPLTSLVRDYLTKLHDLYTGSKHVASATSTRELFDVLFGPVGGLYGHLVFAVASLAWLVVAATRSANNAAMQVRVLAATLAWNLAVFPHQRHSAILLGPAWWMLIWPDGAPGLSRRVRLWLAGLTIGFAVLDVPLLMRMAANQVVARGLTADATGWSRALTSWSYLPLRFVVLALFVAATVAVARGAGREESAMEPQRA